MTACVNHRLSKLRQIWAINHHKVSVNSDHGT